MNGNNPAAAETFRGPAPEASSGGWPSIMDETGLDPRGFIRPGDRRGRLSEIAAAARAPLPEIKFALVGFGPHCGRTHLGFFKKHRMRPAVIVELESAREATQALIREMNWATELVTLEDSLRDEPRLPESAAARLDEHLRRQGITHAVISSEPKGRLMYLRYFLARGLDILADKPIVAFPGMTEPGRVELLKSVFGELVQTRAEKGGQLKLLCQRSEHPGYQKISRLIGKVIDDFGLPITHMAINTCDGNWVMPHDFYYENHPYKYGYGKLFHSGYHYVALLAHFLELNSRVAPGKRIAAAEMNGHFVRPDDLLALITPEDLEAIFEDYDPGLIQARPETDLSRYGECDFAANLRFLNAGGRTMTTAGLSVLQTGFSRRAWHRTKADRYKGNGRVRHEHLNIHVGPLLNVQVHSYQAKECRERGPEEWGPGGLDHFDVDVYRNVGLLGGPAHERFTVRDLHDFSRERYFIGLNELARERALLDFFQRRENGTDLARHLTAMEIFCQLCGLYADFVSSNRMETRLFKLKI